MILKIISLQIWLLSTALAVQQQGPPASFHLSEILPDNFQTASSCFTHLQSGVGPAGPVALSLTEGEVGRSGGRCQRGESQELKSFNVLPVELVLE